MAETKRGRGRPKGSKGTTPVLLADLVNYMRGDQTVEVGTAWLKRFEEFNNVRFTRESEAPVTKPAPRAEELEGGKAKDAEVRERLEIKDEEL